MSQLRFFLKPSGNPHVVALHTAVLSWAIARAVDADLVPVLLNPNESDRQSKPFLEALEWLGVDWDEDPQENQDSGQFAGQLFWEQENGTVIEIKLPELVDAQKRPLSTQSHRLEGFQNGGYLPKALFNYLVLLGWTPASGDEILDKWQIRQQFELNLLDQTSVIFEWERLKRINHHYIQRISDQKMAEDIRPFLEDAYGSIPNATGWLEKVTALIKPALYTLEDAIEVAEWTLSDDFELTEDAEAALETEPTHPVLSQLVAELATVVLLDENTAVSIINGIIKRNHEWDTKLIEAPIRATLTGQIEGAPLATIMGILGKQTTLQRIANVLR